MNLEQAKKETAETFEKLKATLQYCKWHFYEDLNILEDPIRLIFNGWSIPKSYFSEDIELTLSDLIKNIEVLRIFQVNEKDSLDLIKWMLHELKFSFETHYEGNKIPYKVDQEILAELKTTRLKEFEEYRKSGHQQVVDVLQSLLENYASISKTQVGKARKVKWLGTINELCDLIATLERQNWIEPFEKGEKLEIARAFGQMFDVSERQSVSDEATAINTIYRGLQSQLITRYGEIVNHYEKIYTSTYKPKFQDILKNINNS